MLWFSWLLAALVMLAGWYWQQQHRNAGIVDVLWALLLAILALIYALTGQSDPAVRWLATGIMALWYIRLAGHLWHRVGTENEDGRYAHMRAAMDKNAGPGFWVFFQLQALLAVGFSLPVYWLAYHYTGSFGWPQIVAVVLVIAAQAGVWLADHQLQQFRQQPQNRGQVCERGLWFYSRHPNYFFEWLHWFAYPLMAWGTDGAVWLLLAPLVMYIFICHLTGIPYTEQQSIRSRGDAFRRYQKTTSAFIPWRKFNAPD